MLLCSIHFNRCSYIYIYERSVCSSLQDTVQGYDLECDNWELMKTKLPEPMTGVVACRVRLPQRLFEDYLSVLT